MATWRTQIAFQLDSALPKDQVVITPHFIGGAAQPLADALVTKVKGLTNVGAAVPFTVKVYDVSIPKPNPPAGQATNVGAGSPAATGHPRELALCLSYYGTQNQPRYRGRLYIPSAFITGTMGLRPTSTQRNDCLAWVTAFTTGLPSGCHWAIYSTKLLAATNVTKAWCDDEWDVVRSRGLRSTVRDEVTVP